MELRKRIRYQVSTAAMFGWENEHNRHMRGKGQTRDISVVGTFIVSQQCPPVETLIQLDVLLLPLQMGTRTLRLKTVARVIRVEHDKGIRGFAALFQDSVLAEDSSELAVEPKSTPRKRSDRQDSQGIRPA